MVVPLTCTYLDRVFSEGKIYLIVKGKFLRAQDSYVSVFSNIFFFKVQLSPIYTKYIDDYEKIKYLAYLVFQCVIYTFWFSLNYPLICLFIFQWWNTWYYWITPWCTRNSPTIRQSGSRPLFSILIIATMQSLWWIDLNYGIKSECFQFGKEVNRVKLCHKCLQFFSSMHIFSLHNVRYFDN